MLSNNPYAASGLESERARVLPSRAYLEGGWRVHAHTPRVLAVERVIACNHPWIAVLPRPVGLDMNIGHVLVSVSHTLMLAVTSDTCPR